MKKIFPGYFKPSEKEILDLWENGIIVFDANYLLNIYRYSSSTREELLKIIENFREKIWISYQATFEFLQNRLDVIDQQIKSYEDIEKNIDQVLETLKSPHKHPFLDEKLLTDLSSVIIKVKEDLQKRKLDYEKLLDEDDLLNRLVKLLEGRVGISFSEEKLKEIYKEGEIRYKRNIPPGFKDYQKSEPEKYGDLIIWFEMIEKAKSEKKGILFITGDVKEDWWYKFKGKNK